MSTVGVGGRLSRLSSAELYGEYAHYKSEHGGGGGASATRPRWHCAKCSVSGTADCSRQRAMCICRSGYTGAYCGECVSHYDYMHGARCRRCPCDMRWSDGTCAFDTTLGAVRCANCTLGMAGLLCSDCDTANGYGYNGGSGACERPHSAIGGNGASATSILPLVAYSSAALAAVLLVCALLLLAVCKGRRRRVRSGHRVLAADAHCLVADTSFACDKAAPAAGDRGPAARADVGAAAAAQSDDDECSPWADDDYVLAQYYASDEHGDAAGAMRRTDGGWYRMSSASAGRDTGEPV